MRALFRSDSLFFKTLELFVFLVVISFEVSSTVNAMNRVGGFDDAVSSVRDAPHVFNSLSISFL